MTKAAELARLGRSTDPSRCGRNSTSPTPSVPTPGVHRNAAPPVDLHGPYTPSQSKYGNPTPSNVARKIAPKTNPSIQKSFRGM